MPLLLPPPPPPARALGCGRRRLSCSRRRRSKRAERSNWADLPLDALLHVLHRLDHVDLIFGGAAKVCHSWRAAAREPELWRRVDMRGHSRLFCETISLNRMARLSIWFSAGQCESFFGQEDVDDGLHLFLAKQVPLLKSLHLTDCYEVTNEAFAEAINKFPLLEELELCRCDSIRDKRLFELVATSCPRLKNFKHVKQIGYGPYHSVVVYTVKTKKLKPYALTDDWEHFWSRSHDHFVDFSTRDMYRRGDDDERDCGVFFVEIYDSDDSDHSRYFSGADETDFEENDRILPKGMRRCLRI